MLCSDNQAYKYRISFRRNFSTNNSSSDVQNSDREAQNSPSEAQNPVCEAQNQKNSETLQTKAQFMKEFDVFHRQFQYRFFGQLPKKLYSLDEFDQIERIFNQELKRSRTLVFEPNQEQNQQKKSNESQQNQKQQTKAQIKENTNEAKTEQTEPQTQNVEQNNTFQANIKQNQATDTTSLNSSVASQTSNSQTQQVSSGEKPAVQLNITPEEDQKAKKLTLMLNKGYVDCLQLVRLCPNYSLGQIIDTIEVIKTQTNQTV